MFYFMHANHSDTFICVYINEKLFRELINFDDSLNGFPSVLIRSGLKKRWQEATERRGEERERDVKKRETERRKNRKLVREIGGRS